MVRHKTRWLLVQFEGPQHVVEETNKSGVGTVDGGWQVPSKKEVVSLIRKSIASNFGLAAEGAAMETRVRLCDPETRLFLLRVPREFCKIVRSSLTLLTHNNLALSDDGSSRGTAMVASVLSVHGSARTAKLATLSRVRKLYRDRLRGLEQGTKRFNRECSQLRDLLTTIQNID